MRSPIASDTFIPSEARSCGELITLVRASESIACNSAPGRVVVKSWPAIESSLNAELGVVAAAPLAGAAAAGAPRGAHVTGRLRPAVPAVAMVDARSRVRA